MKSNMKVYNLYYKNEKINSKPLKDNDIEELKKQNFIYKKIDKYNSLKLPLQDIKIIKCTLI